MLRPVILIILVLTSFSLSFFITPDSTPSKKVKDTYLRHSENFIKQVEILKAAISSGSQKEMQQQFLATRHAYKMIEPVTEYFFEFYASKLNGPPIPFYKEDEADVLYNEPFGLQVIEEMLFPYSVANRQKLQDHTNELLRYAKELPQVNESFAFNDANIFDALIESVYRITALGITGFDSQVANNSLPETISTLGGIQEYLGLYSNNFKTNLPGKYELLDGLLNRAKDYIRNNPDFNSFNRMKFILAYMNPVASIIGEYKKVYELDDNNSGRFYSAINKNNTLFAPGAFNVNRFLDDFTITSEKIELGRMLFFETGLSSTSKRSCASCHHPGKAFTDGLKTSMALDGHSPLPRNAPTLWNAALQRNLFHDSRSRNLEDQVMQVLNNSLEMHGSAQEVSESIIKKDKYKELYEKAYPKSKTSDAANNICNAIASFERTLVALNSRFDKHMNGSPSLTKNEINGFNLFMGKAKCGTCHFNPLFSGAKPPRYYYMESEVIGVPSTNKKPAKLDADSGRYLITGSDIHLFSFKTPTLRNIELTAPYMHNGVFNTLEAVVDFYNEGGGAGLNIAPLNQSLPADKLKLTAKEKNDLISFMRALTDTVMIKE